MKDRIKQALSGRPKMAVSSPGLTPAAVLLPIYEREGEYYIIFTKRTETVERHKGQISFPGGACDRGDESRLATALREAFEEIGLQARDVEVLGELDDTATSTNYLVSPFVAFIRRPAQFSPDPAEVEEIIEVPLAALLDSANVRLDPRFTSGEFYPAYIFQYQNHVIWGATARILRHFLELAFPEAV